MSEPVIYMFEVILASSVFFLGYVLLKKHSNPRFRRVYLMLWLIFSITFPFISIDDSRIEVPIFPSVLAEDIEFSSGEVNESLADSFELEKRNEGIASRSNGVTPNVFLSDEKSSSIDWYNLCLICYVAIAILILIRVFLGIYQIVTLRKTSKVDFINGRKIYQVANEVKGASFFNWIFIGHVLDSEREVVFQHEALHVHLWHNVDILLSHVYCAVFWINPFGWTMKRQILINAELEVDQKLSREYDFSSYTNMLLNLSSNL